jgi:hypothetical protein
MKPLAKWRPLTRSYYLLNICCCAAVLAYLVYRTATVHYIRALGIWFTSGILFVMLVNLARFFYRPR